MGSLKLPHASGNSMSIAAPATNPASDLELKLPATIGTAGQVLKNSSTAGTLEFGAAGGITHAEQWRVNANFTAAAEPIVNNWERVDGTGQGGIGTDFSAPSSGIWTFPSTGIWWVHVQLGFGHTADIQWVQLEIKATTNNASYSQVAYGWASLGDVASTFYTSVKTDSLIDCTDTANVKFQLSVQNQANPTYQGYSAANACYATFIRLGDT